MGARHKLHCHHVVLHKGVKRGVSETACLPPGGPISRVFPDMGHRLGGTYILEKGHLHPKPLSSMDAAMYDEREGGGG